MPLANSNIIGIQVFLERRKSRQLVGQLIRKEGDFVFSYDDAYLKADNAVSLGPEMPLTRRSYRSSELFVPFLDRIPSRDNPAYQEYCHFFEISVDEKDPLILLSTIAHRGPSSFIFEPIKGDEFSGVDLLAFRKRLGLSVRDFAACFDFSPSSVTRIERGHSLGQEILIRAEIYAKFPEVALFQLHRKGQFLHTKKIQELESSLKIGNGVNGV